MEVCDVQEADQYSRLVIKWSEGISFSLHGIDYLAIR